MYDLEKIQEVMAKHGYKPENEEYTCWHICAGLLLRFDDDMDEPGIVLSHCGRNYFSYKFTMDEIESIIETAKLFNIISKDVVEIYEPATENCEVVKRVSSSSYELLLSQRKALYQNFVDANDELNVARREYNTMRENYDVLKGNLEKLGTENDILIKSNNDLTYKYAHLVEDYNTYRKIVQCIMNQFEDKDVEWCE